MVVLADGSTSAGAGTAVAAFPGAVIMQGKVIFGSLSLQVDLSFFIYCMSKKSCKFI